MLAPPKLQHRRQSSVSACLDDTVREAARWLQSVLNDGHPFAPLDLAHLTLRRGKRKQRWHI
jgi:hypothetical protein